MPVLVLGQRKIDSGIPEKSEAWRDRLRVPACTTFRAREASHGRITEDAIGADIDLVGPGEAYQRWKKLPEYDAWRKEAHALMARDRLPSNHTDESERSAASPAAEPEQQPAKQ